MAIRYAVEGDLRFVSHHDMLRLFERALARADFPVRFSAGFNPRPRMSALLPRPVGVASQDEVLVVEVSSDEDAAGLSDRLAPQMPHGIRLLSIDKPFHYDPRQSLAVEYVMHVEPTMQDDLTKRVTALMSQKAVVIERSSPKYAFKKPVDIRHYLLSMDYADGCLTWTQLVDCDGSVRVGEVLEALGFPSKDYIARVMRKRVAGKM